MSRAASVLGVKANLYLNSISHTGTRSFTDHTIQIEPKTAVADGHHVDARGFFRFFVYPDEDRHRPTPTRLEFGRTLRADQQVRIDAVDFDQSSEIQGGQAITSPNRLLLRVALRQFRQI